MDRLFFIKKYSYNNFCIIFDLINNEIMKNILLIFAVLITLASFSQNNRGGNSLSDGFKIKSGTMKGHPYLLTDFVKGYAIDLNGNLTEQKLLNYDIYNNNLTFQKVNASKDVMVVSTATYSGFILSDENKKDYLFSKIEGSKFLKTKKTTKFYQIAKAPSKNVIIESIKLLKDPNASGWSSSSLSTKRAEFALTTFTYVLNKDGLFIKVKPTKSSILKAFKDEKKKISAFINENGLSVKTAQDLVPIVDYYLSL